MRCRPDEPTWFVYIIRCQDGSLYTGITTDVARRLGEHARQGPKSAKYLRGRGPLNLAFSHAVGGHAEALRIERWIKRQPKDTKETIIVGRRLLPPLVSTAENASILS